MERLAIKWATLEPDAIGSYVTYADAVQAVEETHRSYGGLPSQLEEAKAKIKELEQKLVSTAPPEDNSSNGYKSAARYRGLYEGSQARIKELEALLRKSTP